MTVDRPVHVPKYHDLIYDVGLHKGEDAEFYLRKGFRVVAFEADPDLVAFCRVRLKEFLENGHLTIVEGAIVGLDVLKTGHQTVRFYKNRDDSFWGTVSSDWAERNERLGTSSSVIEVDAINFAAAIREYGVPYFMKIDIEGCDTVCISALSSFEERPTYISIESDKASFGNIEREIDLLSKLGYTAFQAVEQSNIYLTQAPHPPREGKYVAQCFDRGSSGLFGSELGEKWKSRHDILRQYRFIRLGYFLVGDDGIMLIKWRFRGAGLLNKVTRLFVGLFLGLFTHGDVPGWYDTHARHSCADGSNVIFREKSAKRCRR